MLAFAAIALWGCDSGENKTPETNAANAPSAATGATSEQAPPSAVTGASGGPTGAPAEGEVNPNDPGAGDEEAARTPVAIGLKGGAITKGTAKVVHVPSFIAIELDFKVADSRVYALALRRGGKDRPVTYTKPGSYTLMAEGLRPNKTLVVLLQGGGQVTVKADADPGP